MKMMAFLGLTFLAALAVGTQPASADCMCAANGTRYEQGALVCLTVSGRSWLARCGKVLNNSSWEKVGDGCPQTRAPIRDTAHSQPPTKRS